MFYNEISLVLDRLRDLEPVYIKINTGRNKNCIGRVVDCDGGSLTYKIDTNRGSCISYRDCELAKDATETVRYIKVVDPDLPSVTDALGFEVCPGDVIMVSTSGCVAKIGKVKRIDSSQNIFCKAIDHNNDFKVPKVWQDENLNFIKLTKDLLDRLMLIKLAK